MRKLMFSLQEKFEPFSTGYFQQLNRLYKAKNSSREGSRNCLMSTSTGSAWSKGRCFLSAIFDVERAVLIGGDHSPIRRIRG
jgi:hypothetical protein